MQLYLWHLCSKMYNKVLDMFKDVHRDFFLKKELFWVSSLYFHFFFALQHLYHWSESRDGPPTNMHEFKCSKYIFCLNEHTEAHGSRPRSSNFGVVKKKKKEKEEATKTLISTYLPTYMMHVLLFKQVHNFYAPSIWLIITAQAKCTLTFLLHHVQCTHTHTHRHSVHSDIQIDRIWWPIIRR